MRWIGLEGQVTPSRCLATNRYSVIAVTVMHSVLNATGDTFTSPRYLQGNPLIVSAGGVIASAILSVAVLGLGLIRFGGRLVKSIRSRVRFSDHPRRKQTGARWRAPSLSIAGE